MIRLTFHGAAETVTGSKYLLETESARVLIDCGLFQGVKRLRLLNWEKVPFDPRGVDAVVLTHAHLDHIGFLPRLVKQGYQGPVYCTPATADLAKLLLTDSARIQESDTRYANRKKFSRHIPALPLYEVKDARSALKLFRKRDRETWHQVAESIFVRFHDAGHLLGSNMIELEIREKTPAMRLLFSGDVGRYDAPLYHDPTKPPACDFFICESTYGNREHPSENILDQLREVVLRSIERGGIMLMASFAIGRAQQLIYLLQLLIKQNQIPELPIILDSPMATDASAIYREYGEDHDLSEGELSEPNSLLDGEHVQFARSAAESKKINTLKGPAIVIASSGMMTGGRILHHLRSRISDVRNTIVLGGFMAEGTRGRKLQDGAETLRMHGRDIPVQAAIERITGLSGHAGRSDLLRWTSELDAPRRCFITHGELNASQSLAETLRTDRGWDVVIPKLGESFELEKKA